MARSAGLTRRASQLAARPLLSHDRKASRLSPGFGQGVNVQFLHGIVLNVVGDEGKLMVDGHGGNSNVDGRQSDALAPVVAFQQTSQTGYRPGNGIVLQTFEQV